MSPLPDGLHARPGSPLDFPCVAEFLTRCHPQRPTTTDSLERIHAGRLPGEAWQLLLVEQAGEVVGLSELAVPRMDGHEGWLSVGVHTQAQQETLAQTLLLNAEEAARGLGAHTLVTRVNELDWEKTLYETHGYREHDRMWYSTLDLTTLDFGRFTPYEERAANAGITIRPLSELGEFDEAQQRRLYDLIAALLRDVPSTTPISVWPFEVWQHRFARTLTHPEGLMIAVAPDGEWVGVSELHLADSAHPGTLRNGLTGVLPPWRGHGVAYALKLAAARSGLARGFTATRTGNHSINRAMLGINEKLGFVREAATVTLLKQLSGE